MAEGLTAAELAYLRDALDLARDGATDELVALVRAGLPVNLTNSNGDSLLILAAYHNHPTTVQALLREGAEPDRSNDRGQTALGAAVFRRSEESVRALLAAGADPDAGARSARQVAEFFDLPEMRRLLDHPGTAAERQPG